MGKKENRKKREGKVGLEVERRVRLNKLRIVKLRKTVADGEIVKVMEVRSRQEVAGIWMKVSLGGRELNRPQSIHCFQSWQGNMELGRDSRHTDVVEELKNAFELAERSSPGITNR